MDDIYQRIFSDPQFRALQRRRSRFTWALSLLMALAYFSYILVIAFRPAWLAAPLSPETVVTLGIPVGVGLILFGFLLTGLYVHRTNSEFDPAVDAIIDRVATQD